MKYLLLLALLFTALFAYGQTRTKHEKLIGSWYTCKYDGTYVEVHYQSEHIREFISVSKGSFSDFWFNYKLSNDTIIYAKSPLDNLYETDSIRKATIYFLDENALVWQSQSYPVVDTLHRLAMNFVPQPASRSIEIAHQWYKEFGEGFSRRMTKVNCIDRRPPSERKIEKIDLGEVDEDFDEIIYIDSLNGFK